jgi:hypothetical protein
MAIKYTDIRSNPAPGGGYDIVTITGLSTDTKPVPPTALIGDESTFEELDTQKFFTFSSTNTNPATSNGWWEI